MGYIRQPGGINCYCCALDGYGLSISELALGNDLETYNDGIVIIFQ